ncbi:MAG: tRNA (adenosine(37)-N6)-threonylcarbamoyltransferase complex dimerization subunit type 1 TsaB [Steroidobacteraceae bacterium]
MKLLALDTASELCSAALWIDGACQTRECERARGSGELILGMIEQLLAESALSLKGLDAIAFGCGPGAFTGVRLALAVAQGLALAVGLPLLPISDLRALALRAISTTGAPARALICQDARMAEVYWGCFERSGETVPPAPEAVSAPGAVHLPRHWSASPVCGAGSGFEAYEALSSRLQLAPVWGRLRPRALEVARLAALDGLATAVPPDAAEPVYLRNDVATPQS